MLNVFSSIRRVRHLVAGLRFAAMAGLLSTTVIATVHATAVVTGLTATPAQIDEGSWTSLSLAIGVDPTYASEMITGGVVTFQSGNGQSVVAPVSAGGTAQTVSANFLYADDGMFTASASGVATTLGTYIFNYSFTVFVPQPILVTGPCPPPAQGTCSTIQVVQVPVTMTIPVTAVGTTVGALEATVSVTVLNVAPTIWDVTPDLVVGLGSSFDFGALAWDPGIYDVLTYAWDLNNDGIYDDHIGQFGSHAFGTPGTHHVGLRVADGDGGFAYAGFDVRVAPAAAVRTAVPAPAGLVVTLLPLAALLLRCRRR